MTRPHRRPVVFGRPPEAGTPEYEEFVDEFVATIRAGARRPTGGEDVVMIEGDLVARARAFAAEVHAGDERKGSGLPYFEAHLEPVAGLVRQSGGSRVQVAAAYLHDAAEDHGGEVMLDRIRAGFGEDVAGIVEDLSDSLTDTTGGEQKETWSVRKRRYLADLADKPTRSLQVSVADKLQNAQTTLEDLKRTGVALWQDFNEKRPEAQLWYYATLAGVFEERLPDHPLTARMARVVQDMERQVLLECPEFEVKRPWSAPAEA